jgi:hypothetical protein
MRAVVRGLIGTRLQTVVEGKPNTVVSVTRDRALVETEAGERNYASLTELQDLADRVYAGEEVVVPARGRSAFHTAVMARLPGVADAVNPRRVWLRDDPAAFDADFDGLLIEAEDRTAEEGRVAYRRHRSRERSHVLRRLKIKQVIEATGGLACEVCGFDFERT